MDDSALAKLETGNEDDISTFLQDFTEKHNETFTFTELNTNGRRRKLWSSLLDILDNADYSAYHKQCLTCLRILSRDKTDLNELVCEKWMGTLMHHAGLVSQEEALSRINQPAVNYDVMVEALKCLCNLVFNSVTAQMLSGQGHLVEGLATRLRTFRDPELPDDLRLFDMKLLFLVTALRAEVRPRLRDELHGLTYLVEALDLLQRDHRLSDTQTTLACELLKVLFNLTVRCDEEEDVHFLRLVSVLHDLLLCRAERITELHHHAVNLLMSLPSSCYEELTTPIQPSGPREFDFDGRNMEALAVLLTFLEQRLSLVEQGLATQQEALTPILNVLLGCARSHRAMRRFLRSQVLPPLTDVRLRPEAGSSLRGKLCRLLTTPITQVRDLVADFLFVLCKENVMRMIKYTGYGNAAGLFANRGLLLGGGNSGQSRGHYSSDSEDSDTEEYRKFRDQVNPVTGCVEPTHPDPTAAMTEEQKEYEAMQLVNMMDRLARDGIVQPCRVGEDGRPEPVDHILQLVEDLPRQQVKPPHSTEDN